jgi:hypothetical protein
MGNISFGQLFVAGRKRVPRPATGKTAERIVEIKSRGSLILYQPIAEIPIWIRAALLTEKTYSYK